ncbi:riboflavin synthase alpha chain [Nonlabens sp. Hel1_33_55]|uniref:riboflavin synthase n=1 Tax=Nonlabens sp. Hel1_33_55 TaxID=1336802 RepID=UPI000875DECD|nr:riboflavin synthase [Nonlabens sp. Hel1_33_55]SCY34112.1 riboflavin synthase alpha chain [Nonlabens sp. Hel1_33_55]
MFTGIIESTSKIIAIEKDQSNIHFTLENKLAAEFKVDQSVSHDGVCLTVVELNGNQYKVTAIKETLEKTNLSTWKAGGLVNMERAMLMNARLDGHIVQGHVDQIATCIEKSQQDGSWVFSFRYNPDSNNVTIEKGSICINGVSLTVVNSKTDSFSVAIIPYTYEHTGFKYLQVDDKVNLEFDVIGKYVKRLMSL